MWSLSPVQARYGLSEGEKKKKQIGKIDIEGAVIAVVFMHGRNFLSVSLITRKF